MRGDEPCAEIVNGQVRCYNKNAPLYLQRTADFTGWMEDRCADLNRSYVRNILKHLGLSVTDAVNAVKYVRAASLTDVFWVKSEGSALLYEQAELRSDLFFRAALSGDPDLFCKDKVTSPEVTNIGSFNKGWRYENNRWVLYKAGKPMEIWSEIFASLLARSLGFDAVRYTCVDGYSVSENFMVNGQCFEPAKALIGTDTSYIKNINAIMDMWHDSALAKAYMDIIFMDAIVRNGDRHEFNYGFITGGAVTMAPNFDNNMSMFWNGVPKNLERTDMLVSEFKTAMAAYPYTLPRLTTRHIENAYTESLRECRGKVDLPDMPLDTVVRFCMNAFSQLA
jgi:hypothetical protein